jgi:2-polyprenyl-3-methyl-5-hydroxy-6-metoxy-1,4-benzoquinol methylase
MGIVRADLIPKSPVEVVRIRWETHEVDNSAPDDNALTLQTYEVAADEYARRNRETGAWSEVVQLIDESAALLPKGATVLEIGSGAGTEADVLSSRGLRVQRTDATLAFVEIVRATGHDAQHLNVVTDDLGGPWDCVFANAVFLHLSREQFRVVLVKTSLSVRLNGLLVFTLKEGDGDEWSSRRFNLPRHFTYWREESLRPYIAESPWELVSLRRVESELDDWLFCICRLR